MRSDTDVLPDPSPDELADLYARAVRRGTVLRRRHRAVRAFLAAALVAAVAVPVGVAVAGSPTPSPPLAATGHGGQGGHPGRGTGPAPRSAPAGPFQDVAWRQVDYPGLNFADVTYPHLGCGSGSTPTPTGYVFSVDVQQVTYVQPAGAASPIALVLVHCTANGDPPSWLYTFEPASGGGPPSLLQVLLAEPEDGVFWDAQAFTVSDDQVSLAVEGSTGGAPLCCPNTSETLRWQWERGSFQPVAQ